MIIRVSNIDWDAEEQELPDELDYELNNEDLSNQEIEDQISEMLSDDYGFCHFGFCFTRI